jgi:hypothetical protein
VIAKAKLAGMWREKVEQSNSGPVIVEVNRPPSELTGEPPLQFLERLFLGLP